MLRKLSLFTVMAAGLVTASMAAPPPSSPSAQFDQMRIVNDRDLMSAQPQQQSAGNPDGARKEIVELYLAAKTLYDKGSFAEGFDKISEADGFADKNDYERNIVNKVKFLLALRSDKPAVALGLIDLLPGEIGPETRASYVLEIVRQDQAKQDWPNAVAAAKRYLAIGGPDADKATGVLWRGYYTLHDYPNALATGLDALAAAESKSVAPDELLLRIIKSSAAQTKDSEHATLAVTKLAVYYPNAAHWQDAIQDRINQPGFPKEQLALDIFRLMRATDSMTEAVQFTTYATLALQSGIPEEAKLVLDQGAVKGVIGGAGEALRQKAQTESEADQKTLAKSEQELNKSASGEAAVRLGMCYAALDQHDKAVTLIEQGIAKGTPNQDLSRLRLGTAYLAAQQKDKAVEAFKSVHSPAVAELAALWILKK